MIPAQNELAAAAWSQLWQVTALALAVGLVARLVARNRPHLAHVLWLVVLLKCVTPPWCASPGGVFSWAETWFNGPPAAEANDTPRNLYVGTSAWPSPYEAPIAVSPIVLDATGSLASSDESWTERVVPALLAMWGLGILIAAAVSVWRWATFLRRLRHGRSTSDPVWDSHLALLSKRMGVRRRCRLVVTEDSLGPAVVGFVWPTILLPESLLRRRPLAEWEPILAHELAHVRRGDAWIGLLQMVVRGVWWFHPLMHGAVRAVGREAERCCDEEVVAALAMRPGDYARCLLDVLSEKHRSIPVLAFPGIQPVEAVSKRMERIMRLRQGSRRRTPWWCWVVMLVVAGTTLPGAAWVAGEEEDKLPSSTAETKPPAVSQIPTLGAGTRPAASPRPALPSRPALPASVKSEEVIWCTYSMEDILRWIQTRNNVDEETAKAGLLSTIVESIQAAGVGVISIDSTPGMKLGVLAPESEEEYHVVKDGFRWTGTRLAVGQTQRVHQRVVETLEFLRGMTERVRIDVHFISGPSVANHLADVHWSISDDAASTEGTSSSAASTPAGAAGERPVDGVRAHMVIERRLPVTFAVIDASKADKILKETEKERLGKAMQAPSVTVYDRQPAFVSDCSQSPFVVGVKEVKGDYATALQPQINVVTEGTTLHMRPLLQKNGRVRLDCRLKLTKIEKVDTATFNGVAASSASSAAAKSGTTIQCPTVSTQEVDTGVEMALGQTLAIGGLERPGDGKQKPQPMLILIRPTKVEKETAANALSAK